MKNCFYFLNLSYCPSPSNNMSHTQARIIAAAGLAFNFWRAHPVRRRTEVKSRVHAEGRGKKNSLRRTKAALVLSSTHPQSHPQGRVMATVWGAARFTRSRFWGGFVCGATIGAAAAGLLKERHLPPQAPLGSPDALNEQRPKEKEEERREEPVPVSLLEKYGFPAAGAETRYYTNHALSYDQTKRIPRWVIEHISKHKTLGHADRKHCKFRPDPSIPPMFSAVNEDYFRSGWSRGHMAPAGDNKYSTKAMAETFYLSNIVPQNYENNAGFWNRVEMYCRELTERFEDVWIVSGPLTLPQIEDDGKKRVSYQMHQLPWKQGRKWAELTDT